eukprot:2820118-Pyramimonas_sp.AAC.1
MLGSHPSQDRARRMRRLFFLPRRARRQRPVVHRPLLQGPLGTTVSCLLIFLCYDLLFPIGVVSLIYITLRVAQIHALSRCHRRDRFRGELYGVCVGQGGGWRCLAIGGLRLLPRWSK